MAVEGVNFTWREGEGRVEEECHQIFPEIMPELRLGQVGRKETDKEEHTGPGTGYSEQRTA